jgi:hypothetical protein
VGSSLKPFVVSLILVAWPAAASAERYALVVGNNIGSSAAVPLEPLAHAEREAARLRDMLVRYGNFPAERTLLVTGAGRAEILAAARQLAQQRRTDAADGADAQILFAFFFSGHGLAGELLTKDEALDGEDLARIFREMNASLTIGFFDACFSGGLDMDALRAKGAVATPGFNPIAELPGEVLNSEGTMWFVSSRPDELSYEDERLGGLFTHYFAEAFTRAHSEGVGVPLEDMWDYARRNTAAHAQRFGRHQTPQQFVRRLKTRGPIYLSFPVERAAKLHLGREVSGTFVLQYEQGAYVEKIRKEPGAVLELPVFEGEVWLSQAGPTAGARPAVRLTLRRDHTIFVRHEHDVRQQAQPPGFAELPIRGKGELPGMVVSGTEAHGQLDLGVGYGFTYGAASAIARDHGAALLADWVHGRVSVGARLSRTAGGQRYGSWSYEARGWVGTLVAGYGLDFWRLRLTSELAAGPTTARVEYTDGETKTSTGAQFAAGLRLTVPVPLYEPLVHLQALAAWTMAYDESPARSLRQRQWTMAPHVGLALTVPLGR